MVKSKNVVVINAALVVMNEAVMAKNIVLKQFVIVITKKDMVG